MNRTVLVFLLLFGLTGARGQAQSQHYLEVLNSPNPWTDSLMQTMTVREKIAQLMMIPVFPSKDAEQILKIVKIISADKVGGLIFFQGNPVLQAKQNNYYQSYSKIPLLIGMDAEWGVGMRLDSVKNFPYQIALGAAQDTALAYQMGLEIAQQFRLLEMHVNFAPVADLNNNPENPVINIRSFGEEKQSASRNAVALMRGMQDGGILACAKHFPGHGNTSVDSHHSVPTLEGNARELRENELYPFAQLINNRVGAVMMGHLSAPALDNSGEIASLSPAIATGLLRDELGFRGITFSDGMQMKAVTARYNTPQANMRALLAGNDMLVYVSEIAATQDTIEQAIRSGQFPMEVLDEHCRKVLNTKYYFGLHRGAPAVVPQDLIARLNNHGQHQTKIRIIERAITLAFDKHHTVPLRYTGGKPIAYLEVAGKNTNDVFMRTAQEYANIDKFSVTQNKPATYAALRDTLASYPLVVVGYLDIYQRMPQRNYNMDSAFCAFLLQLAQRTPTVVSLFGSPYTVSRLREPAKFAAVLIAHGNDDEYQRVAAQALFGAIPIEGKSPVTVPGFIALGQGLERPRTRLKQGTPQELGIVEEHLRNVDNIALRAIESKAFPGCQIVAAHKGVVFYNKAFGYHTYENQRLVQTTDLYDIASLSKVLGTLPVIMKLYEDGDLDLDDPLRKHLKLDKKSDKGNLQVRDLLMHQSGLKPWLPLHVRYLHSLLPEQTVLATAEDINHPFYLYRNAYLNRYHALDTAFFAEHASPRYSLSVAKGIWAAPEIRKDIYNQIDSSELMSKQYRYSDLGFYYLQRVIEKDGLTTLDREVERLFYLPLNMRRTTYLPLRKFSKNEIAPTEWEYPFRHQLLQGYVHDHGAAVMGGVAGHAGLFASAEDLAKLLQMLLWQGSYGGTQLLKPSTVETFTGYQTKSRRRALGFDKPEPDPQKQSPICAEASPSSYGHTGFTGTMVWVDPARELFFIFLSNRLYPDYNNKLINTIGVRSEIFREFIYAVDGGRNGR